MKARWFSFVAGLIFLSLAAADWPQWRGPNRDGVSTETGLLKEWPKEGPKLAWRIEDAGGGYGAPAVVGGRIYLMGNKGMTDEFVQAREAATGKLAWSERIGKVGPNQGPQYPGARTTPTVDGDRVYALGSDGDLACLEAATGKVQWQKNLRTDFGGRPGNWAYAESPLVDGDKVVCTPGGKEATLVALDKKTGEVIWKSAVPGGDAAGYASIVVTEASGARQYIQFLGNGVVGVDAKTGKFLWRYDRTAKGSPANIPTPVARGELVYTSGRAGGGLVKIKAEGDGVAAEQVYLESGLPTSIGGAVLLDGHLYGTNNQGLVCAEFATGQVRWRDKGVGAGSVLAADGHLYVHGESGEVALVEATPEAYREKGRFAPPGQPEHTVRREVAWAYPALADGRLYVRDLNVVWCYDVKAAK